MINHPQHVPQLNTSIYTDTPSRSETETLSPARAKRNVLDSEQLWPNGSTLKIALYDADEEEVQAIKGAINEWLPHVNLTFDFVSGEEGDIRIALNYANDDAGSAVGTKAKNIPGHRPTMILPGNTHSPRFRYVAMHEFGHALGALHAHQHPDSDIPWDKDKAYADAHWRFGWSKALVDENILPQARSDQRLYQPYDRDSVMHYPISSQWTSDSWIQSENWKISDGDIAQMNKAYPKQARFPEVTTESSSLDSLRSSQNRSTPPAVHRPRWRDADSDCRTQALGATGNEERLLHCQ